MIVQARTSLKTTWKSACLVSLTHVKQYLRASETTYAQPLIPHIEYVLCASGKRVDTGVPKQHGLSPEHKTLF